MSSKTKRKGVIDPGGGKGFALITAILAVMILMALGFLAISVTTGDLKITSRVVGEKKALSAAETGIHRLMQNFDRDNPTSANVTDAQVDTAADPASRYTIGPSTSPRRLPASLPIAGYTTDWVQECFERSVTGQNTNYSSSVTIDVGMGYGPLRGGTDYK